MRRLFRSRIAPLALLLLAGCNMEQRINAMVPIGADALSREYLELVARGQLDSAYERLTPAMRTAQSQAGLVQLQALLRGRSLDSMQRIGVRIDDRSGVRHINLNYQFHDSAGWFVANVAHAGQQGSDMRQWVIEGASMKTIPASLQSITAFTLRGRNPLYFAWLLLMAAAAACSIVTAVRVARTRGMPRRWLWTLVALIGIMRFSLDWSTGVWTYSPVQFLLFSAAFMRAGELAPWILSFALPVGAAVAERKRRAWQRATTDAAASAAASPPPADPAAASP